MIFSQIWQADMDGNGLIPLIKDISEDLKDRDKGYVIVDLNPMPDSGTSNGSEENEISVFKEVVIPAGKLHSYDLFLKLINNYEWEVNKKDPISNEENKEINEFLTFTAQTAPMRLARKYAEDNYHIKAGCSTEEWIETLKAIWFKPFKSGSTSYFEHVCIGEQGSKRRKLGGHHFWYHYYVNDGPYEALRKEDSIVFIKHVEVGHTDKSKLAEVITIKYTLEEEHSSGAKHILRKDIGSFFVGTSPEGLMALGTVAFMDGRNHIPIEINGERIGLSVAHIEENGKRLARTFYPVIQQAVPV